MIYATLTVIATATLGGAIDRTLVGDKRSISESSSSYTETCQKIAASTSEASDVYGVVSFNYLEDISHWALSSTQFAACSFEPGTPKDVGVALQILGQTQTPFAIKGGGHTTNPGFSSTEGVQITMSRFSDVIYDSMTETVTIGAGLIWDDVYAALEPHGVNVVGGRIPGVGVSGFTLGGGYSWLTNQYGLTIDTVQMYELVTPNGTAINVTEASSPDLFFALRGGLNNFGIVTRFTLKTFPQTEVWGGLITYTADVLDEVNLATANFVANIRDPKAVILTTYNYLLGQPGVSEILFYDGPTPPAGIFDEFLAISSFTKDISTQHFLSFVKSLPSIIAARQADFLSQLNEDANYISRVAFNSISVTDYPLSFLESIVNETIFWGENSPESTFFVSYDVEPFLSTLLTHGTTPSGYPPDRTQGLLPLNIFYGWESSGSDQAIYDVMRTSAQTLQAHAIDSGLSAANTVVYPNYAIFDTPLDKLYGANVPRLQAIKKVVDPENVMGLAGGFKL